jgi:LysR family transcriptional regulator, hydrogen peroxide-inducible genes activator
MRLIQESNQLNVNIKQLRFAVSLAELGSFTTAATACFVTQPTLSNGIAQLEAELGERLFVRTTRKVALTAFGEQVMPYMAEVLRAQATLEVQARSYLNPGQRLLRIGTSPLVRANLLSLMAEPFLAQHPGVELVLREMNMTDLYRMLGEGLLDVVIGVVGTHKGAWQATPLYREPLLYLPRGDAPAARRAHSTVPFADIAAETYVMVPDACGLARTTRELFRRHRRKLHAYSGEAMSYQVLQEWAALGIGAAILPQSRLASGHPNAWPIVDKSGRPATIGFEAVWVRGGTPPQAHVQAFTAHLVTVAPRIAAGLGLDA